MDDIKNTIFKLTKTVTKSSGDLMKTTKLSVSLASEEENLRSIYMEIGKQVHEIYAYGGTLGKFFDEKYKEILEKEARINDIKGQINALKGAKDCPSCGKTIDKNAEFCPKCGSRIEASMASEEKRAIPHVEPQPQEIQESVPHQEDTKPPEDAICRTCGAQNEIGTKFCLSCGRLL